MSDEPEQFEHSSPEIAAHCPKCRRERIEGQRSEEEAAKVRKEVADIVSRWERLKQGLPE